MSTVYVLNKDGKPLMPTTRGGHVRHLLKEQKARVVRTNPFTIQLLYETDNLVQPLYLGIDPGRTNIGVAVVKTDGTAVFTAHLETRNKEIPKLMCPYCGRIMTRNSMQVDHIISINLANEHRAYRILVPNDDINNIRNLTASCPECNNRKSDSGGGWIFLGRFGKYIFILIWAILLLSCLAFVLCCMSGTLKRGFLIPYVADIANVLLHWISDTIAQMFRFNT